MSLLSTILYDTIFHSTPIILCVLGGIFAYKANVLNIALEGMMLAGAFIVMLVVNYTGNIMLAVIAALAASLILGLVFSFFGITNKGNVIIIGLGMNMLVSSIAAFVLALMNSSNIYVNTIDVSVFKIAIPLIKDIPFIGKIISGHPPITYLSFLCIWLMWFIMYRTKFGIYVRTVGENEEAAKSIGIKTNLYKYLAVLIGAFCCGLAGIDLSLERLSLFTNDMTAGRGFIAIAAIYCGRGKPVTSALFAIVFGLASALSVDLSTYAASASGLFDIIPYILMTIVLTVVSIYRFKNCKTRGYKFE
jgi:simple sugar transport system permease protein